MIVTLILSNRQLKLQASEMAVARNENREIMKVVKNEMRVQFISTMAALEIELSKVKTQLLEGGEIQALRIVERNLVEKIEMLEREFERDTA